MFEFDEPNAVPAAIEGLNGDRLLDARRQGVRRNVVTALFPLFSHGGMGRWIRSGWLGTVVHAVVS